MLSIGGKLETAFKIHFYFLLNFVFFLSDLIECDKLNWSGNKKEVKWNSFAVIPFTKRGWKPNEMLILIVPNANINRRRYLVTSHILDYKILTRTPWNSNVILFPLYDDW